MWTSVSPWLRARLAPLDALDTFAATEHGGVDMARHSDPRAGASTRQLFSST